MEDRWPRRTLDFERSSHSEMKREKQKAKRLLILTSLGTAVVAGLSWLALRPFPSIRIGITLSLFGCGFLVLAVVGIKTGFMAYELGAVDRADEPAFFWVLVVGEIVAGVAMIVIGWSL